MFKSYFTSLLFTKFNISKFTLLLHLCFLQGSADTLAGKVTSCWGDILLHPWSPYPQNTLNTFSADGSTSKYCMCSTKPFNSQEAMAFLKPEVRKNTIIIKLVNWELGGGAGVGSLLVQFGIFLGTKKKRMRGPKVPYFTVPKVTLHIKAPFRNST